MGSLFLFQCESAHLYYVYLHFNRATSALWREWFFHLFAYRKHMLIEHIFYTCNQIINEIAFQAILLSKKTKQRGENQNANKHRIKILNPKSTMAQTKNKNRRTPNIKPSPNNYQGKKEIMMTKFLSVLSKVFACLVIVVVPVVNALVAALDNYANKGDAYATI